jgi:hypothetical protein
VLADAFRAREDQALRHAIARDRAAKDADNGRVTDDGRKRHAAIVSRPFVPARKSCAVGDRMS